MSAWLDWALLRGGRTGLFAVAARWSLSLCQPALEDNANVSHRILVKRPGLLLEAADGAEDGRSKVYFLAKALYSNVKMAGALSSEELGVAFGRERVIHGLVRKGPIAEALGVAYRRLAGFRPRPELDWFPDQDR